MQTAAAYSSGFRMLRKYGIITVDTLMVNAARNTRKLKLSAQKLGYPVVLKAVASGAEHKTEKGLVAVDIRNDAELERESLRMLTAKPAPGEFVLQPLAKGVELFIGVKSDSQFGKLVLFGLGGVYVELYKDVSARVAPFGRQDALEMINEINGRKALMGFRGKPSVNIGKIADLLVCVGRLAIEEDINELDLNPVIADDKGYSVVDVRMI
ncbi:acetyl-CoA synthetase [Candidatus Micrarchaeota archaeon CG_4_10_14_0_2_um_filter_49_7]|nr:MAG: hypothetical protein AUJ13_00390 [Candidatus Micrarchaeota archaeon CG1_02_49_24]PIZ99338.1 MAG: acetyl-CoA synthetase [Candidatus Micrarchaeota archaeon CG_4_10_14_0_2_um_filter_49_7]HII53659.1 acetyl-CoA synthetase [Candidatus Micrarchaeota archaeon]